MSTNKQSSKLDFLLVDDDETFCMVLNNAIERRGFSIMNATNLTDAINCATQHQPLYAIVDLRIGDESGLELVKKLVELDPNIRIVMLTGYASIATAIKAIKLGAKYYLTKPADADEIISSFECKDDQSLTSLTDKPLSLKRLEWEHLQKVLMDNDGNISATARALSMHRRTLQRKLQKRPVKK